MRRLAVACVLQVIAGNAWAHAMLESAVPAVGTTVMVAPREVVLAFSEGVEPAFSTITVQDGSGARVDAGRAHPGADRLHLAIAVQALTPGTYSVRWRVVSVDTHRTEGDFRFVVGEEGR